MSSGRRQQRTYQLEKLYDDQDPNYALETIPHLICWLEGGDGPEGHVFELSEQTLGGVILHELTIAWDLRQLIARDPKLNEHLQRFRSGKTLTMEDRPKFAAYGLALIAISCLLRRRVVNVAFYRPPDLLLSTVPGALCGVEVAGRSSNGYSALRQTIEGASGKPGKRAQLLARSDVAEAYLSLWCSAPRVSVWEQVKP